MDWYLAQKQTDQVRPLIDRIHDKGLPAGIAGHNPAVFEWAETAGLPVDFYMCAYYNSAHRDHRAEHVSGMPEWFRDEDREIRTALIQRLSKPVIHYKILAAGRNKPEAAFAYAASHMRPGDAACVGIFDKDDPQMLAKDVAML
ncbi:MAG TPA: hypothetical protein PKN91_09530, partial [Steroidobacteraceae bacterium]|nr:hypothetical protein [Steroidobacteraceae bacterium]